MFECNSTRGNIMDGLKKARDVRVVESAVNETLEDIDFPCHCNKHVANTDEAYDKVKIFPSKNYDRNKPEKVIEVTGFKEAQAVLWGCKDKCPICDK